jgi:hypothetical protein
MGGSRELVIVLNRGREKCFLLLHQLLSLLAESIKTNDQLCLRSTVPNRGQPHEEPGVLLDTFYYEGSGVLSIHHTEYGRLMPSPTGTRFITSGSRRASAVVPFGPTWIDWTHTF